MAHITANAQDVILDLVSPGTSFDDVIVPEGQAGLIIRSGTDSVLIIGTPQQLRTRVEEGLSLPIPAGVSLFD